jgi:tRNA dimethylallyltransferase
MDIGTAKPTASEQSRTKHWGLDLVDPSETFTVADFKEYAERVVTDIRSRRKLPIMVGGSGLYIDAFIFDYQMDDPADPELRAELSRMDMRELQLRILEMGLQLPADAQNPRRLMRVIETAGRIGGQEDRQRGLRAGTCVLGIDLDIATIERRIRDRVDQMVQRGLVDEVQRMGERYGWDVQALQAPGYKAFRDYVQGSISLEEAKAIFIKYDRALAKRQKTWFKRNKCIHWLLTEDKLAEAVDIATTVLNTPFHS